MAKYLKDSKGIVRATTTTNLELEKPLTTDNYDITVHNRNMDKIDTKMNQIENDMSNIDLTASKVIYNKNNSSNVDIALDTLFTNVNAMNTEINGQRVKLIDSVNKIVDLL